MTTAAHANPDYIEPLVASVKGDGIENYEFRTLPFQPSRLDRDILEEERAKLKTPFSNSINPETVPSLRFAHSRKNAKRNARLRAPVKLGHNPGRFNIYLPPRDVHQQVNDSAAPHFVAPEDIPVRIPPKENKDTPFCPKPMTYVAHCKPVMSTPFTRTSWNIGGLDSVNITHKAMRATSAPSGHLVDAIRKRNGRNRTWVERSRTPKWEKMLRPKRVQINTGPEAESKLPSSGGTNPRFAQTCPEHILKKHGTILVFNVFCDEYPNCHAFRMDGVLRADNHCRNCLDAGLDEYEKVLRDQRIEHLTLEMKPYARLSKKLSLHKLRRQLQHVSLSKRGSLLLSDNEIAHAMSECGFPRSQISNMIANFFSKCVNKEGVTLQQVLLDEYVKKQLYLCLKRVKTQYEEFGDRIHVNVCTRISHIKKLFELRLGSEYANELVENLCTSLGQQEHVAWEEVTAWYLQFSALLHEKKMRFFQGQEPTIDTSKKFVRETYDHLKDRDDD